MSTINKIQASDGTQYGFEAEKATSDGSGNNIVNTYATKTALTGKQDKLTAGTGISISGNVISATGGGGGSAPSWHSTAPSDTSKVLMTKFVITMGSSYPIVVSAGQQLIGCVPYYENYVKNGIPVTAHFYDDYGTGCFIGATGDQYGELALYGTKFTNGTASTQTGSTFDYSVSKSFLY